jgi:hypothetical protein
MQHVEGDEHARVTDVAAVVNRHSADVDAGLARQDRLERLDAPGQGVVERESYLISPE